MNQQQVLTELFECARKLGNSQDKRISFIKLPSIINNLAKDISMMTYKPSRFHVFVVLDPKIREIFAPAFRDRLAQQWLISLIEPIIINNLLMIILLIENKKEHMLLLKEHNISCVKKIIPIIVK